MTPQQGADEDRVAAMRRFYRAHHPKLEAFVARRVSGWKEPEDVCQETWLGFFVKYDEYAATHEWAEQVLYVIARRRIADFWRKRGRIREECVESDDVVSLADTLWSSAPPAERLDSKLDVELALAALPQRQREALYLRYVDDLDVTQTATLMGISRNGVNNLLKKAREKLRMTTSLDSYRPKGERE